MLKVGLQQCHLNLLVLVEMPFGCGSEVFRQKDICGERFRPLTGTCKTSPNKNAAPKVRGRVDPFGHSKKLPRFFLLPHRKNAIFEINRL